MLIDSLDGPRIVDNDNDRNYIISNESNYDEIIDDNLLQSNDHYHFHFIDNGDEFLLFDNIYNIFRTLTIDFEDYYTVTFDDVTIIIENDEERNTFNSGSSYAYILKHRNSELKLFGNEILVSMNAPIRKISLTMNNKFLLVEMENSICWSDLYFIIFRLKTFDVRNEIKKRLINKLNVCLIDIIDDYVPYLDFHIEYAYQDNELYIIDNNHMHRDVWAAVGVNDMT